MYCRNSGKRKHSKWKGVFQVIQDQDNETWLTPDGWITLTGVLIMIEMKDIDGEPHVIVPKNIWDRMWDLFNKIESGE